MDRLERAQRPVMMVGVEVRRFGLEARVAELARRLHVPVVTSFMGRGLLAGSDVPVVGTYLGLTAHAEVGRPVEQSDCLLLFGVIVSDTNFGVSEGRIDARNCILAADRAVTMGFHRYGNVPLAALVDELARRVADRPLRSAGKAQEYPRGLVADAAPIAPLDMRVPSTTCSPAMAACPWQPIPAIACSRPSRSRTPSWWLRAITPPWFGVPAGLGVQAALGQRPVILVGDGAFQMTGWELGNCRRYGWDPIVIVMNNLGWEMLRVFQPESRFNALDDWCFAEVAVPLGGDGVARDDARRARSGARTGGGPSRQVPAHRGNRAGRQHFADARGIVAP